MALPRPGQPALEATGITRAFGSIRANDGISLAVEHGEMLGVLGENGAGKSTLLSILAGFDPPDRGTVRVDGVAVPPSSTARAIARGISLVHQHFSLVPTFTVAEQLRLAGWAGQGLPDSLGDGIAGSARIRDLAPGQRQRVEVAKALIGRPRVVLLDEPTSILAPSEVDGLFAILDALRRDGTAILFVTHKVPEVLRHADRIVVLRRGTVSGVFAREGGGWPARTERDLIGAMFGPAGANPTLHRARARHREPGSPALVASDLSTLDEAGAVPLRGIDLTIQEGEIRTIVGADGQGQGTLADVLAGYRTSSGRIAIGGKVVPRRSRAFAAAGVGFITGERVRDGGIASFPVRDNLLLKNHRSGRFSRHGLLRTAAIGAFASDAVRRWAIQPPDPLHRYGSLSGGNMQKVILARELARAPRVLIAVNPVAGLDVRTANEVRERIRAFTADGGAVLWFTNDLDDAGAIADTIAVMYEGRLSPPMAAGRSAIARASGIMVSGW